MYWAIEGTGYGSFDAKCPGRRGSFCSFSPSIDVIVRFAASISYHGKGVVYGGRLKVDAIAAIMRIDCGG